jgi:HK97 family phage portal protein
MGLLARVHQRSYTVPPRSLKDPALARLFGAGYQTTSGITVTPDVAFTYSAVYDAVNQISSDVAKLPLNLYKRRPGGGADIFAASPLQRLVKMEPNPEMGSMLFRRQLMVWALTDKGGFAEIQRNGAGQPVGIWPIHPCRVEPYRDRQSDGTLGELYYKIDGGRAVVRLDDMIHISGIGNDPHCAFPLVEKARQTIGLALAAERFGAAFFGNGSTFGGILTTDQSYSEEEAKAVTAAIEQLHRGPDLAHRIAAFWGGMKYTPTGTAPNEAQMDELRTHQVMEVARFYRIPPYRLGVVTAGAVSYSSVESQQLDYYQGCLLDWITLCEEEYNRKLIPSLEARQQYIKHNANAFLRGDIQSRYTALGIARDKGIINANEWRDLEEMNPQDGDQGRQYLVQQAQIPADRIGELVDAQIEKTKADAKPAPPPPAPADPAVLTAANARAEAAERVADEARVRAETLIATVATLEAHSEAGQAEMEAARADVARAHGELAQLTVLATEARRDAERAAEAERRALEAAARADVERQHAETAAELTLTSAREMVEAAEHEAASAAAAQAQARDAHHEAIAKLVAAEAERTAALELAAHAEASEATSTADRAAMEALLHEAEAKVKAAGSEQDRTASALTEASAARQAAESSAAAALLERDRLAAELDEAQRAAADAAAMVSDLTAQAQALATEAETARSEVKRVERTAKQTQHEANAALISAHRSLVADVMRRMLEREADRLQPRAHLPLEKITDAVAKFYEGHEDLCQRSLLPAIRVHLAFLRSDADPIAVAAEWARAHVQESQRQIRAVLEGDADALGTSLTALFRRWETDRVSTVADALMQKELDYARSH